MALPPLEIRVTADTASAEAGLKRVDTQMSKTAARTATYGRSAQAAAGNTANLAAQFNDIGVMLAAGQSPLLLAVQQGTQINQVMGQMGTTGASRVRALGAAFMSMASPANIMTLGIIAGGAALAQWAISAATAGGEADDLSERMEDLEKNTRALNAQLREMRLGVTSEELTLIDAIARKEQEIAGFRDRAAAAGGRDAGLFDDRLNTAQGELRALRDQLDTLRNMQAEKERLIESTRELSDAERAIWHTSQDVSKEAERLVQEIGMAATRALVLADVDITSPISSATKEAAQLAANLGIALNEAMSLRNLRSDLEFSGRGGDPRDFGDPFGRDPSVTVGGGRSLDSTRTPRTSLGSRINQRDADLERLIQSLQTEREILEEWRAEQLDLLAQFNDAELEAIGGHNEARLRLEQEYQERLRDIQQHSQQQYLSNLSGLFGNIATIMEAGGKKTVGIAKAFAIAEGLINSYRAYLAVLADPSLTGRPVMRQVLAASTLAAGLAQVANIRSVSTSGGLQGGRGSGAVSGQSVSTQRVDLNIVGGTERDRLVAQEVITVLNNAQRDGFRLDPRLIGV